MRVSLLCSVASVFLASAAFAQGEGEFPATLRGHAGDWLVDYGDGSLGIVARDIFATTYEILD